MKKIITSAALVLVSAMALAQENYTVKMNMKVEGLPPEMAGFADQETVTYIKGDKTKTEITGMMGTQVRCFDGKTHIFLMDMMGDKTGYTATKEEMAADQKNDKAPSPKIEYTQEKKMIAGYECTKAIVTSTEAKDSSKIIVWITDKIKSESHKGKRNMGRNSINLGDLKGYPLEMDMEIKLNMPGTSKATLIATEVKTGSIDDAVFNVSTEGYRMSTYKEMKEKMKGMQGGK